MALNKKKFTKNLDSLFENSEGGNSTSVLTKKNVRKNKKTSTKSSGKYRKRFTSDLDSLFETVLTEEREEKQKAKSQQAVRPRRSLSVRGLNSLIRKTSDPDLIKDEDDSKRVTFSYTKKAYRKLKKIASERGKFLREVIGEVLNEYIAKYEREKGPLDI